MHIAVHSITDLRSAEAVIKLLKVDSLPLPPETFDLIRSEIFRTRPINWEVKWSETLVFKIIGERREGKRTQYKPITRRILITKQRRKINQCT